ncbi:MAG: hypothetical protein WC829_14265 [Hyphomicrobium sp.]|jgi:hypothetical protein
MTDTTNDQSDKTVATQQPAGGALSPGALSADQLKLMQKHGGKQKFTVKELVIPQLKIVQTSGGYMKKSSPDYIKEAEEGDLIDTLTLTLRKGPVNVVIVRFATTYMESKPDMGPVVKVWGNDSTGYDKARGDFGTRITAEGNEIRQTASYHCLLINPDGSSLPCMLYAGSTAWKEARRLNSLLGAFELMGDDGPFIAPPYARLYTVDTVPMANDKNSWMSWKFGMGGLTLNQKFGASLYQKAVDFEESIDKGEAKVHEPVEDERETEGSRQAHRARRAQDQGAGPDRGPEPPPEAYEDDTEGGTKIPF